MDLTVIAIGLGLLAVVYGFVTSRQASISRPSDTSIIAVTIGASAWPSGSRASGRRYAVLSAPVPSRGRWR